MEFHFVFYKAENSENVLFKEVEETASWNKQQEHITPSDKIKISEA